MPKPAPEKVPRLGSWRPKHTKHATPPVTPKKPKGRSLAEFLPLRAAEEKLLVACAAGEFAFIGDERPDGKNIANIIRSEFLRFLALGGDEKTPVHEHGIELRGAWIEGNLDLEGTKIPHSLFLSRCQFDTPPKLLDAHIFGTLHLGGCKLPGFHGDRMICDGGLFMRGKFIAEGTIRLLGAQIGGDLDCRGARLDGGKGNALSADGATIKGGVFLNEGFVAIGKLRLLGAKIGGNIDCRSAHLLSEDDDSLITDSAVIKGNVILSDGFIANGEISLRGAQITGNLDCDSASLDGKKGDALAVDGAMIEGTFFFRFLKQPANKLSLASCHVGQLIDDDKSWGEDIILDGFSYDHITGDAPTDAAMRLAWLAKQDSDHYGTTANGASFKPQPWQQLIRVLRAMGHEEDARQIAIAREKHLRKIGRIGQTPKEWSKLRAIPYRFIAHTLHDTFGFLIAYGYRPLRTLFWMFLVWLTFGIGYWAAAQHGIFAPSNPLVFNHPAYAHCSPDYKYDVQQPGSPRRGAPRDDAIAKAKHGNWFTCPELAGEYTGFSPMLYSLDLILPLVDLQQEHDWAPIIPTPKAAWYEELFQLTWHHATRWLIWFEILFGWIASLLLVAVLTGLTNRDKD